MIAALLILAELRVPGSVLLLEPPSNVDLFLDSGVLVVRDFENRFTKPDREILYLVRTDCGPYVEDETPDGVAKRWDDRWKSVDAFEVRGPRELVVTAEDPDGSWERTCRVAEVLSCYVHHADIWLGAPVSDGGIDEAGDWAATVASLVAWDAQRVYPCTRARFKRTRRGHELAT